MVHARQTRQSMFELTFIDTFNVAKIGNESRELKTQATQPNPTFTKTKQNIQPAMSLFKSNKNKTASAATTPAQTPRTSLNEQRPATGTTQATKMTREQALEMAMRKSGQAPTFNINMSLI
ncbi:hypothetical protein EC991_006905 [Linnemannia zychae]|nr:hypothetical protein EC991_006905 [Linnemannia zychae]